MLQLSASISFPSDAKHVIDFSLSGYLKPPDEVPIDFHMTDASTYRLSCNTTPDRGTPVNDNISSLYNTLRRSRFGTLFKINYMIRNRKYSVLALKRIRIRKCQSCRLHNASDVIGTRSAISSAN
ncbi:hypothetical protein GJ496_000344 [Pomphorhynchus laevis]|nr:hypothetical protein GJ496_000344 [Pomphorhynchus laevis]